MCLYTSLTMGLRNFALKNAIVNTHMYYNLSFDNNNQYMGNLKIVVEWFFSYYTYIHMKNIYIHICRILI